MTEFRVMLGVVAVLALLVVWAVLRARASSKNDRYEIVIRSKGKESVTFRYFSRSSAESTVHKLYENDVALTFVGFRRVGAPKFLLELRRGARK